MNDNQMRIAIILGSLLAVLLLVLIVVLLTGDGGDDAVAGDTVASSTAVADSSTTVGETSTTAAPTTTAASTTTASTSTTTTTSTITTTTTTTTTTLPPNYALSFDGIDDFASIINSGDFDFGDEMTIEAWVKPTSLSTDGAFAAIARGAFNDGSGGGGAWVLSLRNSDHTEFGFSGCTPGCNAARSGPGGLVVGEWQHVAGQYDGTTLQIYRNGQFVDSAVLSGDLSNFGFLLLGVWSDSFHGLIDEVRVWNTDRGPFDIDADFDRVLDGDEVGLVGYYRFDEGSGQFFGDSTGNGNDGKLGSVLGADAQDPVWVLSDVPVG